MTEPLDADTRAKLLGLFQMPSPATMRSRIPTINNAFVAMIIPIVPPAPEEIAEAIGILGMHVDDIRCAYCGNPATEWDHLRPLVHKGRPTGYISEIANLVPACNRKCNSSKGNSAWRKWMLGKAKHSPATRRIADLNERVARLEAYEQWREPTKVDFEALLGSEKWGQYWSLRDRVVEEMLAAQLVADELKDLIKAARQHKP